MKNVGRLVLFILSIDFGFSKMRRFSSDFCVQKSHLGCVNKHIPRPGSQGFFFFSGNAQDEDAMAHEDLRKTASLGILKKVGCC